MGREDRFKNLQTRLVEQTNLSKLKPRASRSNLLTFISRGKKCFLSLWTKKKHTWSGRLKLLLLTLKSLYNFGTIPITFVINKPIFFLLFTIAPLILYWFSKVPSTCFDSLSCQNLYMHTILYPHKFKFSSVLLKNIVSPNQFSSPWKLSLFSFNNQQTSLTY